LAVLIVTTETIPGYTVRKVIGEIHGVRAREGNVYAEGLISARSGTPNPRRDAVLSHSRDEAIAVLGRLAAARGANAVIGMRFDHRDFTGAWTEICAYGTAVYVVPDGRHAPRPAAERGRPAPAPDVTASRPPRDAGRRWFRAGGRRG
jgi:uncharacterized protein YbjQ (UPF0145 family)